MNDWLKVSLGEVVTLQRGFDLPSQNRKTGKVPIVSSSGISDYHSEVGVKGPGVVTGRYGTIGKVFFVQEDYWPLNTTLWVKDFHGNDPMFSSYLLRTVDFNSCSDKSGVPGVNRNDLHRIPVLLPPLPTQHAIAHVLGTLDDLIELNRETNEIMEEMARALFKSWFVDFDPVRAKLEGRPPAGMDAATAALFPDHFQDSELGQIPKGWEVGPILRQADLLSGGTPKTDVPSYWGGEVPWASAKDVSQCGEAFLVNTERTITKLGVEKSSTKIIPAFATVIVARGATTGRLTMFGHEMAMNQTCYGLRSKSDAPFSLYCHARDFSERLVQGGHGSIFDTITTSTFDATDVILPPKELLLAFDRFTGPMFDQILSNLRESRDLATLRDTLLPKLLSGEVSAPDAEELIAAST